MNIDIKVKFVSDINYGLGEMRMLIHDKVYILSLDKTNIIHFEVRAFDEMKMFRQIYVNEN